MDKNMNVEGERKKKDPISEEKRKCLAFQKNKG